MRRQNISDIVRTMRKQPVDGAPSSPRIVDSVSLRHQPPRFVKRMLIIGRVGTRRLGRFHEERARILSWADEALTMPTNVSFDVFIQATEIRKNQTEGLCAEE